LRYFLLLFTPFLLFASLTVPQNNKELAVLEAFDVEPAFLYDQILNDMIERISSKEQRWYYFKAMNDANLYIPVVKNILAQNAIPKEFLYLAMAESNFSNIALSNRAASGLWQFMPATAKHYKLKINDYVDERRDIFKSTNAASVYLKSLHKRFGKWYLAAIAYNCGGGKLNRAIREAGTDDLATLLDPEKKYIPKESRFYIRKILSFAMVGYDEGYMLDTEYEHLLNRASAVSIATIKVSGGESLNRISKIIDIELEELKKLNRHLKYDFVPPYSKGYILYIPYDRLYDFSRKYTKGTMQSNYVVHIVTAGDNLSYIAKKYGVSYKLIMEYNEMKSSALKLKQKIVIPILKNARAKNPKSSKAKYYEVQPGDSLGSIALKHKVSVKHLKLKNHLSSNLIKVGERLKLHE
jgi:membrane-bound lytic murein transglycosylase D